DTHARAARRLDLELAESAETVAEAPGEEPRVDERREERRERRLQETARVAVDLEDPLRALLADEGAAAGSFRERPADLEREEHVAIRRLDELRAVERDGQGVGRL